MNCRDCLAVFILMIILFQNPVFSQDQAQYEPDPSKDENRKSKSMESESNIENLEQKDPVPISNFNFKPKNFQFDYQNPEPMPINRNPNSNKQREWKDPYLSKIERENQRVRDVLAKIKIYRIYSNNANDPQGQQRDELILAKNLTFGSPCVPVGAVDYKISEENKGSSDTTNPETSPPDECSIATIQNLWIPMYSQALECDPETLTCVCLVRDSKSKSSISNYVDGKCEIPHGMLCLEDYECANGLKCREIGATANPKQKPLSIGTGKFNGLGLEYEYADEEVEGEERFCGGAFGSMIDDDDSEKTTHYYNTNNNLSSKIIGKASVICMWLWITFNMFCIY